MAIWQCTIEKSLGGEYWCNVYHVNAVSLQEAYDAGAAIVVLEKAISSQAVSFTKMRLRQTITPQAQGTVFPLGVTGDKPPYSYMPLFVVARVDIALEQGRPDRKYLKPPLGVGGISNGQLTTDTLNVFQNGYATPITDVPGICDSIGNPWISAKVNPVVGMRQLRRGSRKRTTPIIP